jgi:tetratricopeptide (TPR) repeat protein
MMYSTYSRNDRRTQRTNARHVVKAISIDAGAREPEARRSAYFALMAILVAILTAIAGITATAHAQATRLDAVFERLRTTSDAGEAKRLEQLILEQWNHSGNKVVDSIFSTGISALEKGDLELASVAFDEVIRRAPDFAEGYNKRANVQYLRGNYSAAMRDVSRTLELENRHYGALLGLGMIFEAEKNDDLAMRMFEMALSINPNIEWAQEKLRQIRDRRGIRIT